MKPINQASVFVFIVLAACSSEVVKPDATPTSGAEVAAAPQNPFPTQEELERLSSIELPSKGLPPLPLIINRWEAQVPAAPTVGIRPVTEVSPWAAPLQEAVAARPGLALMTAGMECAAQEYGRFWLEKGGAPPESLEGFWTTRCGSPTAGTQFSALSWSDLQEQDDAKLLERSLDSLQKMQQEVVGASPQVYGAWFGRKGDRAIVVVASATRHVHTAPFAPVPDADGWVTIEGEVLGSAASVYGAINQGSFDMAPCEKVDGAELPRFKLRCPMAPEDAVASIELSMTPPGRLLGSRVLEVLAYRSADAPPLFWERPLYTPPPEVEALSERREQLLAMINHLRQLGGRSPMTLAAAQSVVADELTPHFLAALYGRHPEVVADRIVLGLEAGWSVDGLVQSSDFTHAIAPRADDLGLMFAELLTSPFARRVILNEDAEQAALGVLEAQGGLGMTVTTYATYSDFVAVDVSKLMMDRLNAQRAARNLPPATALEVVHPVAEASLAKLAEAPMSDELMEATLGEITQASAQKLQGSGLGVSTWLSTGNNLETVSLPGELLTQPFVLVDISVGLAREEDRPWGMYVVTFVAQFPKGA